jgi:hypothetical protein
MDHIRDGIDERHRSDAPGALRRDIDHRYWSLNVP